MNFKDPELLELTFDAALKTYWRKKALRTFLMGCGISESFVSTWAEDETKRDFLEKTFVKLRKLERGELVFRKMVTHLSERQEFPDLLNWEDSAQKLEDARAAVRKVKECLERLSEKKRQEDEKVANRQRSEELRQEIYSREQSLKKLEDRLSELSRRLGEQTAGYDFQTWFYDLVDFCEIPAKRPYVAEGRQIDGSVTVQGTTYLVELKFTTDQASSTDIDTIFRKVETKADNTMGIVVSISGYSGTAIKEASKAKTVLLLLDHSHLFLVLRDVMHLGEVIDRVRRHAAQTGQAFLPAGEFGR